MSRTEDTQERRERPLVGASRPPGLPDFGILGVTAARTLFAIS